MKRSILLSAIILLPLHLCHAPIFAGTYSGGSGTAADPYQIATAQHLIEMSQHSDNWDDYFVMIADVNMIPDTWSW